MKTRKLSFRSKLFGITALPLALIGYLSVQDVQDALSTRRAAARQLVELDRQAAVAELADAIGAERSALFDPTVTDADLSAQRAAVDDAMGRLRSPEVSLEADALARAEEVYAQVLDLRSRIGTSAAAIQTAVSSRDDQDRLEAIASFEGLPQQILRIADYDVSDRQTLANLTTTVLLQRARESLALEGTALQQALAEGAPSQPTLEAVGARIGSSDEAINVALDLGVPSTRQQLSTLLQSPTWSEYQALRDRFTRLLIGQKVRLDPSEVLGPRATVAAAFETQEQDLRATMERDTRAIDTRASRDLIVAIAISLGVLLLAAAFVFLLARSIRKSLGRLENRATHIANVELPSVVGMMRTQGDLAEVPTIEEIPVETGDEIGKLSAAFNELHTTAVHLAAEQAMSRAVVAHMFVNLGRRNQKLLMRMLQSLDELEREESDPERLSKLYTVDHLATRMRRNAESLLILAGADVSRRFAGPVLVSELLRSTMSEVEEFDRIHLNIMDDAEITGDAAADLAHLLSELTENAARFSPPTEPIEVIARYTRTGYILAVIDSGLGLTEDEIVRANARIASAATSAETPARNLGLFVVGKLAGKYGMEVEIFDRVPAGLTVRVRIPRSLIMSQAPAGVLDAGPRAISPPHQPPPQGASGAMPVAAEVTRSWETATGATLVAVPPRLPYDGRTAPRPLPSPPSRPREAQVASPIRPTVAEEAPEPDRASAPPPAAAAAASGAIIALEHRDGDQGGEGRGEVHPAFGTARRVAGANLPAALDNGSRPEPDLDTFRRSAESVRSNLGALQRGLSGTPVAHDRPTEESR